MDLYEFTQLPDDEKKLILDKVAEDAGKEQARLLEEYQKTVDNWVE